MSCRCRKRVWSLDRPWKARVDSCVSLGSCPQHAGCAHLGSDATFPHCPFRLCFMSLAPMLASALNSSLKARQIKTFSGDQDCRHLHPCRKLTGHDSGLFILKGCLERPERALKRSHQVAFEDRSTGGCPALPLTPPPGQGHGQSPFGMGRFADSHREWGRSCTSVSPSPSQRNADTELEPRGRVKTVVFIKR